MALVHLYYLGELDMSSKNPVVTGSDNFNLFVLRRLFNEDNRGKGVKGETRRIELHTSISPETIYALNHIVPTGRGRYSAPVVELALRMMASFFGVIDRNTVAEELSLAVKDRQAMVLTLKLLAAAIERYEEKKPE